jgi:precorrin-3B methylase
MDEGADVAWPARHNTDELSALQHAVAITSAASAALGSPLMTDSIWNSIGNNPTGMNPRIVEAPDRNNWG